MRGTGYLASLVALAFVVVGAVTGTLPSQLVVEPGIGPVVSRAAPELFLLAAGLGVLVLGLACYGLTAWERSEPKRGPMVVKVKPATRTAMQRPIPDTLCSTCSSARRRDEPINAACGWCFRVRAFDAGVGDLLRHPDENVARKASEAYQRHDLATLCRLPLPWRR